MLKLIKETTHFEFYKISEKLYVVRTKSVFTPKVGSNSAFYITSKGVVIIDTHVSVEVEKELYKEIVKITNKPVTHVINTHHHHDHVGGNDFYKDSAEFIMHTVCKKEVYKKSVGSQYKVVEVTKDISILKAEDEIQILSIGKGHSTSDIVVFFPKEKALFLGDFLVTNTVGYLAEGFFKPWIAGLDRLSQMDVNIAVPGHGRIGDVKALEIYRDYIKTFLLTAKEHFKKTGSIEGYTLPEKYKEYSAHFFLKGNLKRAFKSWQENKLTF